MTCTNCVLDCSDKNCPEIDLVVSGSQVVLPPNLEVKRTVHLLVHQAGHLSNYDHGKD